MGGVNKYSEHLQPAGFTYVVNALERCLNKQDTKERFVTWDILRQKVNRHRAFMTQIGLYGMGLLTRLDVLVAQFQPNDSLLAATWLFDDWMPDVPGILDEARGFDSECAC